MKKANPTIVFATLQAGSHIPTSAAGSLGLGSLGAGAGSAGAGAASCLLINLMVLLVVTAGVAAGVSSGFGVVSEALKAATADIAANHKIVKSRSRMAKAYAFPHARERSNQRVIELYTMAGMERKHYNR